MPALQATELLVTSMLLVAEDFALAFALELRPLLK